MATPTAGESYPVDPEAYGQARFGERPASDEYAASIERGGDGPVAVLEGGYLSLNTHRARRLRPVNGAVSLCVRAWVGPEGHGALVFSDFVALAIHPTGLAIGFLGVRTPGGRVFRELPLGHIGRGRWLDLHYVSDDLVHWSQWRIGPWADSSLDVFGIYLMNHFVDDQGTPRALYTGQGTEGKFGVLARSVDGLISYADKKAVLTRYHQDGHVWKEGDTWYTITSRMCRGTRPGKLGDAVMLWSSADPEHWEERAEIFTQPKNEHGTSEHDRTGFMEFPYMLAFGGREVLILGGHPVRYWVGRFDRRGLKFVPDGSEGALLDKGLLEVFVNGQTCTTAAPERLRLCTGLDLFSEGGAVRCSRLDVWTMEPASA